MNNHCIPVELVTEVNRTVFAHIEDKSAHSDIADVLIATVKPLGDVQLFCPDWQQYRYVVASTRGVIFGIALGMDTIALRLNEKMKSRALATGAVLYPSVGRIGCRSFPFAQTGRRWTLNSGH